MGSSRANNTAVKYKIKSQKGATLIFAIAATVIALIILGGIYYFAIKFFKTSEDIKTYSSSRDAAAAGVNYVIIQIDEGRLNLTQCKDITLRYKLSSDIANVYKVNVKVCPLSNGIYSIVATANGPFNTVAKIEASYAK